jgi:hypothetical protein
LKSRAHQTKFTIQPLRHAIAILWVASLAPGASVALGQEAQPPVTTTTTEAVPKIPNDQLDSLVAPT